MAQVEGTALIARLTEPRAHVVRMVERAANGQATLAEPVVHIVHLTEDLSSLALATATVDSTGQVRTGSTQSIPMAALGGAKLLQENQLAVLTAAGQAALIIHNETPDDAALWNAALNSLAGDAEETTEDATQDTTVDAAASGQQRDEGTSLDDASAEEAEALAMLKGLEEKLAMLEAQSAALESQNEQMRDEVTAAGAAPRSPQRSPQRSVERPSGRAAVAERAAQHSPQKPAAPAGHPGDAALLEQLREKEAIIDRLSTKLEHALEMIKSVHSMYEEQTKVVEEQAKVINSLAPIAAVLEMARGGEGSGGFAPPTRGAAAQVAPRSEQVFRKPTEEVEQLRAQERAVAEEKADLEGKLSAGMQEQQELLGQLAQLQRMVAMLGGQQ